MQTRKTLLMKAGIVVSLLSLAACGFDMTARGSGKDTEVDIHTPMGNLSVRPEPEGGGTGLPVYPGAVEASNGENRENANVNIDTAWFGVKVAAAKFESDDAPLDVTEFYRKQMAAYGGVTECRGQIDFKGRKGARQPICKEKRSAGVQLVTGTEERQRIVVVKPKGSGTEFALVYVETRGAN